MTAPTTPAAAGTKPAAARRAPVGELVFAVAVVALGGYVLLDAGNINVPITSGAMGPRTMPYLVGGLLVLAGLGVLATLLRGRRGDTEDSEDIDPTSGTDWLTVGILVAVVVVHILLISPLGWPIAATMLFAGTAITLGSRPIWRAILTGLAMALIIQIAMAGGLGISLPAGPLLEEVAIFRG
ncbi:tripartite tricarboxylate transporter TctB family protein [Georgenia sp. Z1491]|uniref:tripartite tricarboxylate transporter TctB family protein n=1 Tax=Georgenia sp. Z1491 TaxID=3416707 RepID=UPI003CED048C